MSFALIGLRLLGFGRGIVTWLSHRSFWQLVCIGLVIFGGIQTLRVRAEQRHSAKVEAQLLKATGELKRISTKRNEQKAETAERIKVVTRTIKEADGRAKVVEQAPLPGNCRTPSEVLQADL